MNRDCIVSSRWTDYHVFGATQAHPYLWSDAVFLETYGEHSMICIKKSTGEWRICSVPNDEIKFMTSFGEKK